jgi:cytosine/adenosine deaminase-related metal-dependent hydrolase
MDAQSEPTVINNGVLYIQGDTIVDVRDRRAPIPPEFTEQMIINTDGTIYPGMIELHNHLSYNIVPMWKVPRQFLDRDQWRRHEDYRKKMTGPLEVLGQIDGYLQAIVRFVECRLLFSGVTSSQGITLASHQNIKKFYKGIVRNVEQTVDPNLPDAHARIADVTDAKKLLEQLKQEECYLLHLAEGVHLKANKHFKALQISSSEWAITDALAGIHAIGLLGEDFATMARYHGSLIWSPMSNFLLYGVTTDIASAKQNNLIVGLGSDWTASGSKNLLCELKVAKLVSEELGSLFSDVELIRMVTTNAAKILKWDKFIGNLEAGKKADVIVLTGKQNDPFKQLIDAKEQDISLVIIDGWPRIGQKCLMEKFDIQLEEVKIGSSKQYLYLKNKPEDNPIDIDLSFNEARELLKKGMNNLPEIALELDQNDSGIYAGASSTRMQNTWWRIYSDHDDTPSSCQRHHLPYENEITGGGFLEQASIPLTKILEHMDLDIPTIAEDQNYFIKLAGQRNLPEYIKQNLPQLYGQKIDLTDVESLRLNIDTSTRKQFNFIQPLSRFYEVPGYLSLQDRINIIDQASILLEQAYVHLPLKRTMHASNPLEQLKILRHRIQEEDDYVREIEFHSEIIKIFNSVRDLHTTYHLPSPFFDKVAFLPFFIEEYFVLDEAKYIVSKLISKTRSPDFIKGVEITDWNYIPIQRAIKLNGDRYAGSNPTARFARGINSMTFRPLAMMLPPEEEMVTIGYVNIKGKKSRITLPWMVGSIHSALFKSSKEMDGADSRVSSGYDYLTYLVYNVKKWVFAPKEVLKAEKSPLKKRKLIRPLSGYEETSFPGHFRAKRIDNDGASFGYIRIFSFATNQPKELVLEFKRLLNLMPENGVILDVRSNGGGNILAAEWMLQTLTDNIITPQPAQFINTSLVEELCRLHSPSATVEGLNLTPWYKSIKRIKQTGAVYTLGYPITPPDTLEPFLAKKKLNLVLITDALCYSATDIFASGFQDHKLGKIVGTHENTGAGGANVWPHSLLFELTRQSDGKSKYFQLLPYGANFRIAIRRTLRVGPNAGIPIEDLGVKPDIIHHMTKDDLFKENVNLLEVACKLLTNNQ